MAWPVRITTLGPIAAGTVVSRERGVTYVTAVAKATFTLIHEALALQVQASPLVVEDEGDPSTGTLRRASEVAPYIPGVDVLLSGHARSSQNAPAPAVATRLVVADQRDDQPPRIVLDKTVHAYGRRERSDAYPEPFGSLTLDYDHAEKPSKDFPVGATSAAPQFVLPGGARGFASYGPLAPHWPTRTAVLGGAKLEESAGQLTLSEGFPFEFFHAAPPDQRVSRLRGGEWLLIDGMHPDLARFASKLPYTLAEAQLFDETGKPTPIRLSCDTMAIDMDERTCTLLFRGRVRAPSERLSGLSVVASVQVTREPLPEPEPIANGVAHASPESEAQTKRRETAPPTAHKTDPPPAIGAAGQAMPFRAALRSPDAPPREPPATGGLPFGQNKAFETPATDAEVSRALQTRPPPRFEEDSTPDHDHTLPPPIAPDAEEPTTARPPSEPPQTLEPAPAARAPKEAEAAASKVQASEAIPAPPAEPPAPVETGVRGEVLAKLSRGEAFYDANLSGADLSGIDFSKAAMSGANLGGAKLVGCKFDNARLGGARLIGADLTNASLKSADLTRANLSKTQLGGASFEGAVLTDANLTLATATHAVFDRATGQRTALTQGTWTGASFKEVDLSVADFSGAELNEAIFEGAKLPSARFADVRAKDAKFTRAALEQATFQGGHLNQVNFDDTVLKASSWERAEITGCTFKQAVMEKANLARTTIAQSSFESAALQGANLIGATGNDTTFAGANLTNVDARQTKLSDCGFEKADLRRFNAHKASLVGGRFDEANLGSASLRGARLKGASFRGADLADADLRDADLENAKLTDVKNRASAKLMGANLRGAEES